MEIGGEPQIDAERSICPRPDLADGRAKLVGTEHEAGHDPEGAGAGHLGNQIWASNESHARLQNRVVNRDSLTESRPKHRHTPLTFGPLNAPHFEPRWHPPSTPRTTSPAIARIIGTLPRPLERGCPRSLAGAIRDP